MINKSYTGWWKLIFILLGMYFVYTITPVYLPIIISLILAFILNPLVDYFSSIRISPTHFYIPRSLAILLAFFCTAVVVIIMATFVLFPFIHEFDKFIIDLPSLTTRINEIAINIEARASMVELPFNINTIIDQTISSAATFSADLARRLINFVLSFASKVVELVVVPVLTYYFLKDWRLMKDKLIAVTPIDLRHKLRKIIEEMGIVISGYIRGQVLISIVIGLMVFCGMYFLGVPYPLVLGLLATLTETIPIVGPIIGSVPAILLAYLLSPILAVKVIVFYLFVHQAENHIVVPNIMGHTIDLHPVVVIISLLIGGQLYGIMGMIFAVPVAALLRVIAKYFWITDKDE